jgi:hypothetical protein
MIDNQAYSMILPARIVEYFKETQTATIQISAEGIHSSSSEISQTKIREPIEDVPVHTPSGGGWALTVPIKKGDTCLIVFSQIGYDHWLFKDEDVAGKLAGLPQPWLNRQFSVDDGFAFVGFNTLPRAIDNYTDDGSQWRNEDTSQSIHLKDDLSITVDSPTSVTINAPQVIVNSTNATINAEEDANINAKNATITTEEDANIDAKNVTVSAEQTASVSTVNASISADATVSIDAPVTTVSGTLTCGALTAASLGFSGSGASDLSFETDPSKPNTMVMKGHLEVAGLENEAGTIEVYGETTAGSPLKGKVNGIIVEEHTHVAPSSGGPTGGPINPP